MDPNTLVGLLGAVGAAGVLGAVVQGFINRRKLNAEATQIITQAAGGVVERLEAENARQAATIERLERADAKCQVRLRHLEEKDRARDEHDRVWMGELQLHATWDSLAMIEVSKRGGTLPEAPPLYPASKPS